MRLLALLIQPIDYFLVAWFVLAAASTLYVGIDQYRNNPEPVVMKWGFILVTLYNGATRTTALCPRRQGAAARHSRRVRQAFMEARHRFDHPLCFRRRHWYHPCGCDHCIAW